MFDLLSHRSPFLHFLLFQAVWALCVIGASGGAAPGWNIWAVIASALVLLQLLLGRDGWRPLGAVLSVALLGISIDLALMVGGIFHFPEQQFPLWLALLWCAFALSFRHVFGWLLAWPLGVQAVLGAFGGALSYYLGARFGAVRLAEPVLLSLTLVALYWAVLVPLLAWLLRRSAS